MAPWYASTPEAGMNAKPMNAITQPGSLPYALCADDFALTVGVSRSILMLLEAGRLTATGAMTNRPHWRKFARELQAFSTTADIGLHFNLTCAAPLSSMPLLAPGKRFPALAEVARGAVLSGDIRREIATELDRQLDAFEDGMGHAPAFVDGHQHVHMFPGVRRIVLEAVARRYPHGSVWLRDPADSLRAIRARGIAAAKATTVAVLARGLRPQAKRFGIPVNRGFSGFSPFDPARDFGDDFARFVQQPGELHLVMCHPGLIDDELATLDPVVGTRPIEHVFLMSDRFAEFKTLQRMTSAIWAATSSQSPGVATG